MVVGVATMWHLVIYVIAIIVLHFSTGNQRLRAKLRIQNRII